MNTDSLFQIIDRFCVAKLKVARFSQASAEDGDESAMAAAMAQRQADDLAFAGDVLFRECVEGKRVPQAHQPLRFHNHREAEGGQEAPMPQSVMGCANDLADVHAKYWELQTEINALKFRMRTEEDNVGAFNARFVDLQRKIDMCNQRRNDLIGWGDRLFVEQLRGEPGRLEDGTDENGRPNHV